MNPVLSYSWTPLDGLNLTDPLQPVVATDKSQIYSVIVTDGLCSVTGQVAVNILDSLDLTIEVMSESCDENFILRAIGGRGEGNYEWSENADFSNILGSDSILNFTLNGGMQRVYVRYRGPFCNSVVKFIELSNELPEITKPLNLFYCGGDELTAEIKNNRDFQNITIAWQPSRFIVSELSGSTITIKTATTDAEIIILPFKVTNQFGCSLEDTLLISPSIRDTAALNFIVKDCENFEVCFTIDGNFSNNYLIEFGDGNSFTGNLDNNKEICYTYASEGRYEIKLSSLDGICGFLPIIEVIELNTLNGDLGAKDTIVSCKEVDVTIGLREGLPDLSVIWRDEQGMVVGTGNSITVKALVSAIYTIEATDVNGCKFSDTVRLEVLDNLPMLALPADFRACQGDTAVLPIVLLDPSIATTVVWDASPYIISGNTSLQPTVAIGSGVQGIITLRYTATNALGCITVGEISFEVGQRPIATISAIVEDCGALQVCFKAEGNDLRRLAWDFGDPNTTSDVSNDANVCYTYPSAGNYLVTLRSLESFCAFETVTRAIELNTLNGDLGAKDTIVSCKEVDVT
ncbi:MAG TPA: PKD domain-containing protein, partial [Saprospiraceae bacterium]|nr:PKD domain-containing protein [Saprospiraceae bacterium]